MGLVSIKLFLYFSHILHNFWMVGGYFSAELVSFMMSFVNLFLILWQTLILGAQIMICPKLLCHCQNQPKNTPCYITKKKFLSKQFLLLLILVLLLL